MMYVNGAFSHKALPSGCGEKPINLAITCDVQCVCISGEGLWEHTHYIFFIVILKFPVWRQENYLYQSIKNLLCKREDLSSIPSIDIQSQVWPLMFIISRLEVKKEIWLRNKGGGGSGEWPEVACRRPCAQGHISIPLHTCTYTNTRTHKHTNMEAPISSSLGKGLISFHMGGVLCFVILT